MIVDGKDTSFTFDGVAVGGIESYDVEFGVTGEETLEDMDGNYSIIPTIVRFGTIALNLYRDTSDAGQIAMESARTVPAIKPCAWTLPDGSTRSFNAFVRVMPFVATDTATNTSRVVLRITSSVV